MEIEYRGANCAVIRGKKVTIVVDPTTNVSVKELKKPNVVILATREEFAPVDTENLVINMPGEYEINDVSVRGVAAPGHFDPGGKNATMYRIEIDGVRVAVVGHTVAPLSDDNLESLGVIDVALVPVGGGGYTLDARDAAAVTRQLSPQVVIPTHFADSAVKYEVPQEAVELFEKEIAAPLEKQPTLKIKGAGNLPEAMTVFELSRTA